MLKALQLKYIGERKHQHLDLIPLDSDNVEEFVTIFNACFNNSSIQEDDIICDIKKMQGYIIYDSVAVGVIWLRGNSILNISILPKYDRKGYRQKALFKSIEIIRDNVLAIVDDQNKELFINNSFIIDREL